MARSSARPAERVTFTLNGATVEARPGETLLQAAQRQGVAIPNLCHQPSYRPAGNCRACMVEIEGEKVLAPACSRQPSPGMVVHSASGRARQAQRLVLELLRADMPADAITPDNALTHWCERLGVAASRFPGRAQPAPDSTHPAISVRLDACIQCTRCVRACREEQGNDVIGMAHRGEHTAVVFDLADPMGASSCVACGECVQACPTGALRSAGDAGARPAKRRVDSVCPYCGVGCLLSYALRDHRILRVEGRREGPANRGRLCVKGRYGQDYVRHPGRLTRPLIRREDAPKGLPEDFDPRQPLRYFREADWDEALDRAAAGLLGIRERHGPRALAGFGSAKGSNEEAYLFQKLVRTGFGSNNVDHCTRLCHASSVAALMEGLGSAAVSNPVSDVAHCELMLVIGANPTVNHPVAATFMKNAARAGAQLVVMDPRRTELARQADHFLQFRPDTDVALLNALMYVIIEEGLTDEAFIAERTEGFEALRERVMAEYSPEAMAPVCGIPAATLRQVARRYARSRSMIFWGMGVSQHVHGTDNARCLIALALMTGNIGRRGTGLHPLRGQNNVQGASDAGLIPMFYPDYAPVGDPNTRRRFERFWGVPALDPEPGLTVVEVVEAIHAGTLRGMYILGENPAMSDPDLQHARAALARLDHLVVQDIFLTETAAFADVVLPASAFPEKTGSFTNTDRRVQLGRQALPPPGDARQDWRLIQALARRMGLDWRYQDIAAVYEEMRQAMPSLRGISWARLQREESVPYPCHSETDPGQTVLFGERFPRGRGRFVPARFSRADELPDAAYPWVLITGRQLEHWHTGAMTRRAPVLDALEPAPVVCLHPEDLAALGAAPGEAVTVRSRRGRLTAWARADEGLQRGEVFLPFAYVEAAANLLTNAALDPWGKIPEFKFCAVQINRGGQVAAARF